MASTQWWTGRPNEKFWLEITNRPDIGADLNAPQTGKGGKIHHAYALIQMVRPGDTVFHYNTNEAKVVAASRISGTPYPSEVVWGSLADGTTPYPRPGWRVPLEHFCPLSIPLTLEKLREDKVFLARQRDQLRKLFGKPIHYPFEVSAKRPIRLNQSYLAKLPAAVVQQYDELLVVAESLAHAATEPPYTLNEIFDGTLGTDYRTPDESKAVSRSDPFDRDPALVERAHQAHAHTQNLLASAVRKAGFSPRSASPLEPNFDLAWNTGVRIFVAEVKSLTDANEEKQLRLGLGQVLRYRQLLAKAGKPTVAVLAVERRPADSGWLDLCRLLEVDLVWPETMEQLFSSRA